MRTWKSLTGWRLCRPCLLLTKTPYDGVAKMHQATSRDKHEGAVAPPQDARLEFMDLQFGNKKPQRQAYTVYIQYGKTLGLGGGMLVVMCSKDWESRSASLLLSAPPKSVLATFLRDSVTTSSIYPTSPTPCTDASFYSTVRLVSKALWCIQYYIGKQELYLSL
jgi:hypothetical protein